MHMSDALLSAPVGFTMCAVSAAAIGYSTVKIKKEELNEKKLPVMAVAGAFVFAAQMINFTIPATGSSGHIGGGILLAAMLGQYPALLTIAAVLAIQCLCFADGGLLALGCNIFNMGIIPCLMIYPLLFKPIIKGNISTGRITVASMVAVVVGLQLGAFSVVAETTASKITALPFLKFIILMQPIHLAIGVAEGFITASVLCFVYKVRPELLNFVTDGKKSYFSIKKTVTVFIVASVIIGGCISYFASSRPDGLEWSIEKVTGTTELETDEKISESAEKIQSTTALMPDYEYKNQEESSKTGTAVAGIGGGALTVAVIGLIGMFISKLKKRESA